MGVRGEQAQQAVATHPSEHERLTAEVRALLRGKEGSPAQLSHSSDPQRSIAGTYLGMAPPDGQTEPLPHFAYFEHGSPYCMAIIPDERAQVTMGEKGLRVTYFASYSFASITDPHLPDGHRLTKEFDAYVRRSRSAGRAPDRPVAVGYRPSLLQRIFG